MQLVAKAEEDRQPLIDSGHLFPRKFPEHAPDPPLVDGSQMVNQREGPLGEAAMAGRQGRITHTTQNRFRVLRHFRSWRSGSTPVVLKSGFEWRSSAALGPSRLVLVSSVVYERARGLLWRVARVIHCHQRADRSFFLRGRQVPVCARCLGLLLGVTLVPLYCPDLRLAAALIAVMLLDGSTQALHLRESRNWLRFLTGIGFSLGCGGWLVKTCQHLWNI